MVCQDKKTPLHVAVDQGNIKCLNALMQHADIGAALTIQDKVSYNYFYI